MPSLSRATRKTPGEIDWPRTRAYTNGLAGFYINTKGREREGCVERDAVRGLMDEIIGKLRGLPDPKGGDSVRKCIQPNTAAAVHPKDPCKACVPSISQTSWSPASGKACDDDNPCTLDDKCKDGVCAGTYYGNKCGDGLGCTDDVCDGAGGCTNPFNTAPCDDGDACTTADTCAGGTCVGGAAPDCDDSNICTDDSCDPHDGCLSVNNTAACDDGKPCTVNETCADGVCVEGEPNDCDDANADRFPGATEVCDAAGLDVNVETGRTGVETVLQQLLEHRALPGIQLLPALDPGDVVRLRGLRLQDVLLLVPALLFGPLEAALGPEIGSQPLRER